MLLMFIWFNVEWLCMKLVDNFVGVVVVEDLFEEIV